MGFSSLSAGEPFSIRSTDASVLVAKNWKMVSIHRALICSQSRKPSAYAAGQLAVRERLAESIRAEQSDIRSQKIWWYFCYSTIQSLLNKWSILTSSHIVITALSGLIMNTLQHCKDLSLVMHLGFGSFSYHRYAPMGSHIRSIEPWLPPWLLNQSANETLSRLRTACMPPSGSMRARTTGDVPRAREFAACSRVRGKFMAFLNDSCLVILSKRGSGILAEVSSYAVQ